MPLLPRRPRDQQHPQVVLVTGASSGIGRATAVEAGRRGDHLVLVARAEEPLAEVEQECQDAGAASVTVLPADVGDDDAVAGCVAAAVGRHGRIDAVVNSAGVVAYGRFEEVPREVFEGVIRTNLLGSANVARHVLPVFRRQGSGTLVLMGSVLGHLGAPTMTPYVVSKWGVRALARQLQLENRDLADVHISHIAPGGVDTPIYEQGANAVGVIGQPPPAVSPERVARRVLDSLGDPPSRLQVGIGNDVMRFGFTALPALYDAVVGPALSVVGFDRTRPVAQDDGNVLEPRPEHERLHGGYPAVVTRLGRQALATTGALARRVRSGS